MELDTKRGYVVLLDLLARLIDANKEYSIDEADDRDRLYGAHCLANKLIEHAYTILYLSHGTHVEDIPSFTFTFLDSPSVDVLARTTFEAFLVFHHVFFSPITADLRLFRYLCYKAAGMAERQGVPAYTEEQKKKLAEERAILDELFLKLKSTKSFQNLSGKQKREILKGRWRLQGWQEIAKDAGFGQMLGSDMYRHLCGYAHSSWLSVIQVSQATLRKETELLVIPAMNSVNLVMSRMIFEYCATFPKVKDVLDRDTKGKATAEAWLTMSAGLT